MKIAFSTAALFPRPTLEALRIIGDCGFEFAEVMPQCRYETTPEYGRELLNRGLKVKICSIHFPIVYFATFYNPYKPMRKEAALLIDDLVQMGRILGALVIVIHPPRENAGVEGALFYSAAVENIRYLCDRAAEVGAIVAIENSPESTCRSPEGMRSFLSELGRPNACPMLDTTEAMKANINPIDFVQNLELAHLHASDYAEGVVHLPVGQGRICWEEFVGVLKNRKYQGYLVLEPAYTHFLSDIDATRKMLAMKEFMNNLCEQK